ncbi:hypothetical protein BUALT_Bualt12G0029600 [Buddleja alternifolia]|uniref:Uncharacterized protein n=1 Tax=Buddleja alternifolia TaxID=168488 RepID=A0AAV6WYW4_9LAMI|nr:hypothetical protein BUALT_Bualt12G0029600 [Buddleja alternifolia]
MSNGDVRKVSLQDIQLVQDLIERCLQLYMNQREVMSTLSDQANIEPGFTELVWQKLEAENREFFSAYHLRLIVKDQISRFNQLLERQVQLMEMYPTGVVSVPFSNGTQIHSMHNNSAYQAPQPAGPSIKPENMHQSVNAMPNVYANGTSSLQPCMQAAVNMAGRVDMSANMLLVQNSNAGMVQGMNGTTIKTESGYASDSPVMFGGDNNFLEHPRNAIGETSISHFNGGESSSSHALNEAMMDPETNSIGYLGQIPRNFSLSDLTADFSNNILESYSRSPFMGTDANFLDPHTRGEQQDIRRLDTISEGFSYEDFGSD